jgi:hypothetical protein
MNFLLSEEEHANLFEQGKVPKNLLPILGRQWDLLPVEVQEEILRGRPVLLLRSHERYEAGPR